MIACKSTETSIFSEYDRIKGSKKTFFHSNAIEEPFWVLQGTFQWTVLKKDIFFLSVKNIWII